MPRIYSFSAKPTAYRNHTQRSQLFCTFSVWNAAPFVTEHAQFFSFDLQGQYFFWRCLMKLEVRKDDPVFSKLHPSNFYIWLCWLPSERIVQTDAYANKCCKHHLAEVFVIRAMLRLLINVASVVNPRLCFLLQAAFLLVTLLCSLCSVFYWSTPIRSGGVISKSPLFSFIKLRINKLYASQQLHLQLSCSLEDIEIIVSHVVDSCRHQSIQQMIFLRSVARSIQRSHTSTQVSVVLISEQDKLLTVALKLPQMNGCEG